MTAVPPAPVPVGNSFQPLIRAVALADSKFLAYQQSLKAVPLPPDVNQLKLFLSGDGSIKIPLRQSFYENLLQSPHWQHISSIAVADDQNYSSVFEGIIASLSNQILGCHSIESEIPMARFIDDNMMVFLSLLTGCDIFHNVTATTSEGLRPDLFLANRGFAPIFVGEDKLRKNYLPGVYKHDPVVENVAKTPWNAWNDFFHQAPYIFAYSAIGDNSSIDTTIGALDPNTRQFVPIHRSLNILNNPADRVELFMLCVMLFPVILQLHAIIRNSPTQIHYNIEDQRRIMGVDVNVKKSPYSRENVIYFHKEWTFPLTCIDRAQIFYQKLQLIFTRLQNHRSFVHLSNVSRFGIDENVVKATFEPYGIRVPISAINELLYYVLQICEALMLLHSEGVIHNDIRWDNILLPRVGEKQIFLIDFDDAFIMENPDSRCPPIPHLSVEEHAPNINEDHGPEVDIFAIGKLILNKLSEIQRGVSPNLETPFQDISQFAHLIIQNYKTILIPEIITRIQSLKDLHGLTYTT